MNKRALIIEDRPEVAKMYRVAIEQLDYDVDIAIDLRTAYDILQRIPPPDMVFLDLNLSHEENAAHTVQQIAYIKSFNPEMVLIVISGVLTADLIRIATLQGADQVREKLDMLSQVDLWKAIEDSYAKAPDTVKGKMAHQLELLKKFARQLNLL